MISLFRSLAFLVVYSFKRQLRSKKMLLAGVLLGLLAVVVFAVGLKRSWTPRAFCEEVVLRMVGIFFLPVVTLIFGTGALGDDRDEKSLIYLLVRPLPRSGVFLGKLAAVVPLALFFTLGGLWFLYFVAQVSGEPLGSLGVVEREGPGVVGRGSPEVVGRGSPEVTGGWEGPGMYLPALLLGSLAYLALFHFLAAAFRHSTLLAIAYVFFVEVFLGRVPGIMKRVSISFYTSCMVYDAALPLGVGPSSPKTFLPVDGAAARSVLLLIACGFTLLGALYFARREYPGND
jgi:hypothetical protein